MTRVEFLEKLKEALSNGMDSFTIQGHLNYYKEYIDEEMKKGRSEKEVMDELGDPWVIARSLMDAPKQGQGKEVYGSAEVVDDGREDRGGSSYREMKKEFHLNHFWGKLATVLVIVGIVFLIFSIISGIISLIAPVVVPVLIIVLLINFFKNRM